MTATVVYFFALIPCLNLRLNIEIMTAANIHTDIDINPFATTGWSSRQFLAVIDLNASIDKVNGRKKLNVLSSGCMASNGHIIPENKIKY